MVFSDPVKYGFYWYESTRKWLILNTEFVHGNIFSGQFVIVNIFRLPKMWCFPIRKLRLFLFIEPSYFLGEEFTFFPARICHRKLRIFRWPKMWYFPIRKLRFFPTCTEPKMAYFLGERNLHFFRPGFVIGNCAFSVGRKCGIFRFGNYGFFRLVPRRKWLIF